MPDPAALRLALLVAVSAGFFLLVLRMAWTSAFLRFPAFWSYCLMMGARYGWWALGRWDWHQLVETVIAAACLLAVAEAWWAVTGEQDVRRRRRLAKWGLLVAMLAAGLTAKRMPHEPNPIREYQRYWLMGQMGMAGFAVTMAAGNRRGPWTRAHAHGAILMVHLLSRALNFINYANRATEAERFAAYYWQQFTFLPLLLACLVAWWFVMRRWNAPE